MKSLARPVFWVEPWPKLVLMPATLTPRPTCAGLVPATSPLGAEPLRSTWDRVSSKTVWLPLKPTVLTLAMLLPATSSLVWWARRPEMAENMERSTGGLLAIGGRWGGAGSAGGGAGGDEHGGDGAGDGGAVVVGVGDVLAHQGTGAQRPLEGQQLRVLRGDLL